MPSTIRFLQQHLFPRPDRVSAREVTYHRDDQELPATLYGPADAREPLPGWVLLHGMTHSGRKHASLVGFARALAAAGSKVLVPEIPEWRRLQIAPAQTTPTIQAGVLTLDERSDTATGRIGVIGFSLGATQALIASVDPRLEGRLSGVVAWGGYCDIGAVTRFQVTGEHEWRGEHYAMQPDPYVGWIFGAEYLTRIPGHEDDTAAAEALHALAREAGRRGVPAWDPVYDPIIRALREKLTPDQQPLFDVFAQPAGESAPDIESALELTSRLTETVRRTDPLLDPTDVLPQVRVKTLLAHGRDDRLIPFTETLRLERSLPSDRIQGRTITALFEHSGGAREELGPIGVTREGVRFFRLLNRLMHLV